MLLCRTPVKPTNACAAAHQGTQMPCGRSSGRSHLHTSCRAANVLTHQTHCCCKADGTAAAAARRYVPAKYSCCSCVAAAVLGLPVCYKPYTHAHTVQPAQRAASTAVFTAQPAPHQNLPASRHAVHIMQQTADTPTTPNCSADASDWQLAGKRKKTKEDCAVTATARANHAAPRLPRNETHPDHACYDTPLSMYNVRRVHSSC